MGFLEQLMQNLAGMQNVYRKPGATSHPQPNGMPATQRPYASSNIEISTMDKPLNRWNYHMHATIPQVQNENNILDMYRIYNSPDGIQTIENDADPSSPVVSFSPYKTPAVDQPYPRGPVMSIASANPQRRRTLPKPTSYPSRSI